MNENLIDSIIADITKLREEDKYTIEDLESFEGGFKSNLMKKYIHGLHESEPEAQLRATLLNRETPLFKWIFGEDVFTETHGSIARTRSVDNVAEFFGYGRIGIEIKPFFKATFNERTKSILFKKVDLDKKSQEKSVMQQIKDYLFSPNISKEYLVLTNLDSFFFYSKTSVMYQKETECSPFIKVPLEVFLKDFRRLEVLPEYIKRLEEGQPKLPLDEIFLKDLVTWAKKITSLKFIDTVSEDKKFEFAINVINRFVFIQTLDLYWVIERDTLITKWKNQSVYEKDKDSIRLFLIRFLTDIFGFFWDFYDTELFEIGESGQLGVINFLKQLNQSKENLYNFYKALRYLAGIQGNALQRGVIQYNLKDLDSNILGKAYETFLARRKQRGIYYTPTYVSRFIVKNSIDSIFINKIERFEESLKISDFSNAEKVLKEIYTIRVLDPACGSGSFIIIAYNIIADHYDSIYEILENKFKKVKTDKQVSLVEFEEPNQNQDESIIFLRNQYGYLKDTKRTAMLIVLRHIFGNDFDSGAILVTKLSILINIIKRSPTIYKPENLKSNKILPYLKFNFLISNFLVNISKKELTTFIQNNHIEHLKEMSIYYKSFLEKPNDIETISSLKNLLNELVASAVKNFEIEGLYNDTERIPFLTMVNHWFLYFNDDGTLNEQDGFDVVIGNPPYISLRDLEREYYDFMLPYLENFNVHTGYNDEFYYFIEQSIRHLKHGGMLGFITSNYFFQNTYAEKLRVYINKNSKILLVLDFKQFRVFPNQGINTSIVILERKSSNDNN